MKRLGPSPGNAWRVSAEGADLVRVPLSPRPLGLALRNLLTDTLLSAALLEGLPA